MLPLFFRSRGGEPGEVDAGHAPGPQRSGGGRKLLGGAADEETLRHAQATVVHRLVELLDAGRCLDGDGWDDPAPRSGGGGRKPPGDEVDWGTVRLVPERDYLTGHLWPKHASAVALAEKGQPERVVQRGLVWGVVPVDRIAAQARKLIEVIEPAVLDDIGCVSPRQGWVPLDLVSAWISESLNPRYGAVRPEGREGLVQVPGLDHDQVEDTRELAAETRRCIGWINHDKTTFKPKKKDENIDEVRLKKAQEWEQSFRAWVGSDPERSARPGGPGPVREGHAGREARAAHAPCF